MDSQAYGTYEPYGDTTHGATRPIAIPYPLVVESDADNARTLLEIIRSEMRLDTLFARTMKEALHLTSFLKPLFFLINETLSDGDGLILYDQLHHRAGFESIPAIILSTKPPHYDLARAQQVTYLEMPFEIDDLLKVLTLYVPSANSQPPRTRHLSKPSLPSQVL